MTISFTAGGPVDTLEKLHALNWGDDLARLRATGFAEDAGLTLGTPYQVDYLSLDAVAHGSPTEAVHTTQWRNLLHGGGRALAEVESDGAGDPIALHEGPAKDGLEAAIAQAESLGPDFTARVVQSAPLKFSALKLEGDGKELFIPYPPNLTPLPNYQVIPADEAFAILKPLAAQILEASKGSDTSGG